MRKLRRRLKSHFSNAGIDIDDAKDALRITLEFFQNQYNDLIEQRKR